jgi:hypothetical protein
VSGAVPSLTAAKRFDRDPRGVRQRAFGADQRQAQPQSVVRVPQV